MTSAASAVSPSAGRLSKGLRRIGSAQGSDAVLFAAAKAAQDLGRADGVCLLPKDFRRCWMVTVESVQLVALEGSSSLCSLASAAPTGVDDAVLQHRPGMEVEFPDGRRLRTETLLTVPFGPDSVHRAISFFWCDGYVPSTEQLSLLPALAWATSLALRAQQHHDDLQRSQERQRTNSPLTR